MAAIQFFQVTAPYARQAAGSTGIPVPVILAQWALETGYGTHFSGANNLANITDFRTGGFRNYATVQDFLSDYVRTLLSPTYAAVIRTARGGGTDADVARALGASPWDIGHYRGSGAYDYPGGLLVAVLDQTDVRAFAGRRSSGSGAGVLVVLGMAAALATATAVVGGGSR